MNFIGREKVLNFTKSSLKSIITIKCRIEFFFAKFELHSKGACLKKLNPSMPVLPIVGFTLIGLQILHRFVLSNLVNGSIHFADKPKKKI